MIRYKLTIEYHGGFFCGWQRQKDVASVQQVIEEALLNLIQKNDPPPILHCAGRTDTGVHAIGQVAHVDISRDMQGRRLLKALNYYLKGQYVKIVDCQKIGSAQDDSFHARFSCIERSYRYRIINRQSPLVLDHGLAWQIDYSLDEKAMHQAAQHLIGQHDYSSFRAAGCQANSPLRSINEINVIRDGCEIDVFISARSFLYHQVRNIVGSLVWVGRGYWSKDHLKTVLEAKDRTQAGPTAPAQGLYFLQSKYP